MHNRNLRVEYKLANGVCELTPLLVEIPGFRLSQSRTGIETNHIFSIGRRPDVWPNLIDLNPEVHWWFHRELTNGRVACLYAKWLKGGRDWNVPEMDAVSGRSLLGWLETLSLKEPFATWRTVMVEHPMGAK